MSQVPKGWTLAKLPDVLFFQEGPGLRTHQYRDTGIPFLNIRTFVEERIDRSLCKYLDAEEVRHKYSHFLANAGDILIATSGSLGKLAIVHEEDLPLVLNTSITRFRPHREDKLTPRFAYWFLKSDSFFAQARAVATGSAQLNFGPSHIRTFTVPLPPPEEQRRITDKLDGFFERSKSARTELARIPRLVQRCKQAILASAFRGELTAKWRAQNGISIERDWIETTLGKLSIDIRYGTSAKCHYEPKDTPVLRIPNVVNGRINTTDIKYGHFEEKETKRLALKGDDLLVIRSNGSLDLVGRAALVTDEVAGFLYAGYLIRLRFDPKRVNAAYVQLAFEEPSIRQHIEDLAKSTSGVNNINSEQLKALNLPVPPLPEQCEIVERVQRAFVRMDEVATQAAKATGLLDRLDEVTLAKAFRGELVTGSGQSSDSAHAPVDARGNLIGVRDESGTTRSSRAVEKTANGIPASAIRKGRASAVRRGRR